MQQSAKKNIGTYEIIGSLGSGVSSDVFEVKKNGSTFAGKASEGKDAMNEISLLRAISHPNVARVIDVVFENFDITIIEPKYNLSPRNNFGEEELFRSMGTVMDTLIFLEGEHILVDDLHIANIMWNYQDQPVLIDFGYNSRNLENSFAETASLANVYTFWASWTEKTGKPKAELDIYVRMYPELFENTKVERLIMELRKRERPLSEIFGEYFGKNIVKGKLKLKYPYPLSGRIMHFETRKNLYSHFRRIRKTSLKSKYVEAIQLADRIYNVMEFEIEDLCTLAWNLLYGGVKELNQEVIIEVFKLLDLQIYSLTLWDFEKSPTIDDKDIEFMLSENFPKLNFEEALNYN